MKKRVLIWGLIVVLLLLVPIYFLVLASFNHCFGPNSDTQNRTEWICRKSNFEFSVTEDSAPYYGTVLIQEQEYQVELVFHNMNEVRIRFGQSEEDDVPLIDVEANYIAFQNKIILYNVAVVPNSDVPMAFYEFFHTFKQICSSGGIPGQFCSRDFAAQYLKWSGGYGIFSATSNHPL